MRNTESPGNINPTDVILDNLLDAVLIVDQSGSILYSNKAAELMFGKKSPELLNQNFGYPVTPYEVQEIQVMNHEKFRIVQMLASVIQWATGDAFLLSLRDVTDQKMFESQLQEERRKLEITNFENEQYASLASHDLKEPVRKIMIFCDRLMSTAGDELTEKVREQLVKIHSSAVRMQMLISGIADFSRITKVSEAFIDTDLSQVVADVCGDLELLISEKKAIIEAERLGSVEAIPTQMHQLFLNLISNSIKYAKPDEAPHIRITSTDAGDEHLQIELLDNGIGFENKFSERVFQPFARLHSAHTDGSGIGLAICKRIVEAHNGSITVESAPGRGCRFRFTIGKRHIERPAEPEV